MKKLLIVFAFLLLPFAYAQEVNVTSAEQAIEIAKQYLLDRGTDPKWFNGEASAELSMEDKRWYVFLSAAPPNDTYNDISHSMHFVCLDGKIGGAFDSCK